MQEPVYLKEPCKLPYFQILQSVKPILEQYKIQTQIQESLYTTDIF
jgi:hypothetical protein